MIKLNKILSGILYLFLFFAVVIITGYLTFTILSFSRTVEVPELRGLSLPEANSLVSKRGLYLKVEGEEYDPVIPPGHISRQDIPSNNKVKENRGIKVFISKGPKALLTPEVTGLSIDEAESVILKNGIRLAKVIYVHSETIENGKVIAQRPDPEERPGDTVSLIVSAGPYQKVFFCPDFIGKDEKEADDIAERLGLKVEFMGSGRKVISQKPRPGSIIKSGETIHLNKAGE
ncbi:MAG: PASTA domain-containing protein [Thermodesulfovibrionales bacterium]